MGFGVPGALLAIAAAASTASSIATATKGGPKFPKVAPAPAPPPVPPAPPPLPPPPTAAQADTAIGTERRKRATKFGVAQTLLTSPLGQTAQGGNTLLGGG